MEIQLKPLYQRGQENIGIYFLKKEVLNNLVRQLKNATSLKEYFQKRKKVDKTVTEHAVKMNKKCPDPATIK